MYWEAHAGNRMGHSGAVHKEAQGPGVCVRLCLKKRYRIFLNMTCQEKKETYGNQ
ncbi:hypothetical protein FACS189472_18560 [Alphaproteobacteria bacterium]|nr:hypothetical protein FACS189472_18560 [Alphaproteobacteria bacterium]